MGDEMTDDKVKAREFRLYIHGEPHKGYLTIDPLFDMKPPYKAGTESVDLIEKSSYLALQSELTLWKERAFELDRKNDMNGLHIANLEKERDGLRAELKQSKQVNMILRSDYFAVREYWLESDKKKWELKAQLAKYEQESTEAIK